MLDTESLGATVERATTAPGLAEAYALVHDAYVEKGYITPRSGGVRVRVFEALPEMATFVARVDGRVVAVTSVVSDSPDLGLPSDQIFPEEIERLRAEPGKVCEITNLAVAAEYRNSPLLLRLIQACFAQAQATGCGNIFIAISPGHARFFHDVCRFECLGQPRDYSEDIEDIVQAMRLCLADAESRARAFDRIVGAEHAFFHDFYFAKNSFHGAVAAWGRLAAQVFAEPTMLRDLFVLRSRFLLDCSDDELDAVRRRWGDHAFWGAWGESQGSLWKADARGRPSPVV